MMSIKLSYILPEYDPNISEHYFHIYELIDDISRSMDVFLIIERAVKPINFKAVKKIYILRFARHLLGLLERLVIFTIIRLRGYSTFYVHYSYSSAIAAALVTRLLGGQTFYWHCGLKKNYMSRWALNWSAVKAKVFDDYAFLLAIRLVQYLVTGSETMRNYYVDNFGLPRDKIKIMPNWVNLERFRKDTYDKQQLRRELSLRTDSKVILFVHWLSPRKGAQYLVKIAEEVIRNISEALFLIVGDGPYRETLKREIEESDRKNSFRMVGSISNVKVPKYYAVADLFIMPSEEEGFPRVLLEAMAMGIPFVANDVGGVRDILTTKQLAFINPVGDITAFSGKIIRLLNDDKLRNELKAEGFTKVKEFDKHNVAEMFADMIAAK